MSEAEFIVEELEGRTKKLKRLVEATGIPLHRTRPDQVDIFEKYFVDCGCFVLPRTEKMERRILDIAPVSFTDLCRLYTVIYREQPGSPGILPEAVIAEMVCLDLSILWYEKEYQDTYYSLFSW